MDFLSAAADDDVASVFGIKQKDQRTHRTGHAGGKWGKPQWPNSWAHFSFYLTVT